MKTTVLNSLKIKENFKSFEKIDFGCDYLILSYSKSVDFFDELLYGVDSDNSNFGTIEIDSHVFTYNKQITPNGFGITFLCDYNGVPTPIFQYVKFNQNTRILFHKSAKISIYGSYFRLESIGEFTYHGLTNYIAEKSSENPDITRFDFRVDYFSVDKYVSVPTYHDICGYVHSKSDLIEWKKGKILTDWILGNSKTGRYAIRYYDKKLDTNKKNKRFLYTDFLDYKTVHRLEIEFGRAFCRGFKLSQLNELEFKIMQVIGLDGTIYDGSLFYQYNSDSEITLDNANNFINRFSNLSNKLYKAGYNPFSIVYDMMLGNYGEDYARGLVDDFISKTAFSYYERHYGNSTK